MEQDKPTADVLRFIADRIDTVPHLEALLLVWESKNSGIGAEELAARIYVSLEASGQILKDLEQRKLVRAAAGEYLFDARWDTTGEFMARIAATYRRHLIRIATLIHAKASPSVREFARAFESNKES
jgi:hypothetical protein